MNEQREDTDEDDSLVFLPALAPLATARLILRSPEMADATAIVPLADNMRIAQQTRRMPHPYGQRDAEAWVAMVRSADPARESGFLITRKEDGAIVGAAGYVAMDDTDIEVGYWVGEPFWGKGYATEAAQAVVDHAFRSGSFERIFGRVRATNAPSRRVLEKCGFQYAGAGMCDCNALNSTVPSEEFVLERSVWESLKRWGAA
jgi:RimJ/RimL family protein N-acetyltransferase